MIALVSWTLGRACARRQLLGHDRTQRATQLATAAEQRRFLKIDCRSDLAISLRCSCMPTTSSSRVRQMRGARLLLCRYRAARPTFLTSRPSDLPTFQPSGSHLCDDPSPLAWLVSGCWKIVSRQQNARREVFGGVYLRYQPTPKPSLAPPSN